MLLIGVFFVLNTTEKQKLNSVHRRSQRLESKTIMSCIAKWFKNQHASELKNSCATRKIYIVQELYVYVNKKNQ